MYACGCGWMWVCAGHTTYMEARTTFFETGSFVVYDCVCQAGQPKTFWGYCYLYSLSPIRSSEVTEAIYHNQLYMSSRDLNSDLHVCVGSVTYWDISPILRFQVRIKHKNKNCPGYEFTNSRSKSTILKMLFVTNSRNHTSLNQFTSVMADSVLRTTLLLPAP